MNRWRAALVGCGTMGEEWLNALRGRKDLEICALVDTNIERAKSLKEKFALTCEVYGNLTEALNAQKPNLVFDLTIFAAHHLIVPEALRFGCDVLGEKPLAANLSEANEILSAVRQTGKRYILMQNRRYLRPVRAMVETARSGCMGETTLITATTFVHADLSSVRPSLRRAQLQDNAVHAFDQARYILGCDPVSAYCDSYRPKGDRYLGENCSLCVFEFENGARFVHAAMQGAEGFRTTWHSSWRVQLTRGAMVWDGVEEHMPKCQILPSDDPGNRWGSVYEESEAQTEWNVAPSLHPAALADMFAALNEDRPALTECFDNIMSFAMVDAAMRSADEGRKVRIVRDGDSVVLL